MNLGQEIIRITNRGDVVKILYPDFFYISIEERNLEDKGAEDEFTDIDQDYVEEEFEK